MEIKRFTDGELRKDYTKKLIDETFGIKFGIIGCIISSIAMFILWIFATSSAGFNIWMTLYLFFWIISLLIIPIYLKKQLDNNIKLIRLNKKSKKGYGRDYGY